MKKLVLQGVLILALLFSPSAVSAENYFSFEQNDVDEKFPDSSKNTEESEIKEEKDTSNAAKKTNTKTNTNTVTVYYPESTQEVTKTETHFKLIKKIKHSKVASVCAGILFAGMLIIIAFYIRSKIR